MMPLLCQVFRSDSLFSLHCKLQCKLRSKVIKFEGRHSKCMPNICIQFWRALLLDLKYC